MNNNTEKISIYHNGMFWYKAAFIMYATRSGGGGGWEGKQFEGASKKFLRQEERK